MSHVHGSAIIRCPQTGRDEGRTVIIAIIRRSNTHQMRWIIRTIIQRSNCGRWDIQTAIMLMQQATCFHIRQPRIHFFVL